MESLCAYIYTIHIVSRQNFKKKLETLIKIKLGYSYSSSYNCFGLQAHKKKIVILKNTSTCIHTRIHKRYLLAFVYR